MPLGVGAGEDAKRWGWVGANLRTLGGRGEGCNKSYSDAERRGVFSEKTQLKRCNLR